MNVFTDGSVINNCRKSKKAVGGIGIFFGDNDPKNVSEEFMLFPITNQRTELYAIIRAFEICIENQKLNSNLKLNIYSDSQYAIKSLSVWKEMWKKRGWKKADGKEPLNMDLIFKFDKMEIHNPNIKINFIHVKAHKEMPKEKELQWIWWGNKQADILAKKSYC